MKDSSIWMENEIEHFPCLKKDIKTKTLIIGGGITGVSLAYYLSKKNEDFILVERDKVASKTSGHNSAHLTAQHGAIYYKYIKEHSISYAKKIYEQNQFAIDEIERICKEENIDCDFKRVNSFIFSKEKKGYRKILKEYRAYKKLQIKGELAGRSNLPFGKYPMLKMENQAYFNPRKYIKGLINTIDKNKIHEHTPILKIDTKTKTCFTDKAKIKAENIVIATRYPIINFPGMYFTKLKQKVSYINVFDYKNGKDKDIFIENMFSSIDNKGHTFRLYDDKLIVAGESHRVGCENNIDHHEKITKYIDTIYPNLNLLYTFSAMDSISIDDMAYVGYYAKKLNNIYLATGFRKWGLTTSNISARILSDYIIDKKETSLFYPFRKKNANAMARLISQNIVVFFEFIKGYVSSPKSKTCSHLKCKLVENNGEYVCPCHASRFDKDGNVIDAPAIHKIK